MPNEQATDWVSPPSETILRLIHQKGINLHLFRIKTGLSIDDFIFLLHDRLDLSLKLASILSETLGGSQTFWINRYHNYFEDLPRVNKLVFDNNSNFLLSLAKARHKRIEELLDNFKVSTYEHIVTYYLDSPKIMYSQSQKIEPSPVNIANWVRKCELVAEKIIISQSVPTFSSNKLNNEIPNILSLTKVNDIDKTIAKLKSILLKCGVVLVLSPSKAGNGVSGFTKTILKKYRLVVVTDRYKNNAAFWFTLFHELAHCILHSINDTIIHYSDEEFTLASLPSNHYYEEKEANDFVESLFFPPELMRELERFSKSYRGIMRLGVKYDISTALIVAQIHRRKIAPYSYFRKIFRKVKFTKIS